MPNLTILTGLPASGKSTWAFSQVREVKNTVRINRDDIRAMLFSSKWTQAREKLVVQLEKQMVRTALANGYNVIVDDTNLSASALNIWTHFEAPNLSDIQFKNFDTSIILCRQRDAYRGISGEGKRVGRAIIDRMALTAGLIKWDDLECERIVICDIDGTVADLDHRLHTIATPGQKDYREFHARVGLDTPITTVIQWVSILYEHYNIIYVSGRGDECAIATEDWLTKYAPAYDFLFMRRGGDYRPDTLIKREILSFIPKELIEFVIDDRPSVIRMWKEEGLRVIPVHQDRWEGRE